MPALGLDGVGSAGYGPEAMLAALAVTGAAVLGVVQPITWAILALRAVLFFSYWETIAAYPSNGGRGAGDPHASRLAPPPCGVTGAGRGARTVARA